MNIEVSFIKSDKLTDIINIIQNRIKSSPDKPGIQPDIGIPNSYDTIIAKDSKRKVAISDINNGWITILESKEVNDYKLLVELSKMLETEILAIVLSDVTGSWGYIEFIHGKIINKYFSENDDNIEELVENKLERKKISTTLYMFREIVSKRIEGWIILNSR